MPYTVDTSQLTGLLRAQQPGAFAVYRFGSHASGAATRDSVPLAESLQRMTGFRNIAAHDYQKLQLPVTVAIIELHLDEFLDHSRALVQHDAGNG